MEGLEGGGDEKQMSHWVCMDRWGKQVFQKERRIWDRGRETCHHTGTKSNMRDQNENAYYFPKLTCQAAVR